VVGNHRGTADPRTVTPDTWRAGRLPVLSDFEILGAHPAADGIQLAGTMLATIRGMLIRKCRYGVHLVERNRNVILSESHIYDGTDTGVLLDHVNLHQANFVGNHISYNRRAGIRQLDGDVHNIQITGNDIEYNYGQDGSSGEIVLEAGQGTVSEYTIASNTIQAKPESPGANILILGRVGGPATAVRIVAITGNVIGSRAKNVCVVNGSRINITGNSIYGGTDVNVHLDSCHNVLVGSNTLATRPAMHASSDKYCDGLLLEQCVACAVHGNLCSDHRQGSEAAGGSVTLRRCRTTSISGCQILDPHFRGIHLHDTSRCHVSGNLIADRRTPRQMRAAIEVSGSAEGNVIQGNTVDQGTVAAIRCSAAHGHQLGNTVWDKHC
jgi:hypothetical protein